MVFFSLFVEKTLLNAYTMNKSTTSQAQVDKTEMRGVRKKSMVIYISSMCALWLILCMLEHDVKQ